MKTKCLLKFIGIMLMFALTALNVEAYDFKVDNIAYTILPDGYSVEVSSGTYGADITIPSTVNNDGLTYNVTQIGDGAFLPLREILTHISIPSSITKIGRQAFLYCSKIQSISLPNSITEVGTELFGFCDGLESVQLPENLTEISDGMFEYCTSLKSISLPKRITKIGDDAFLNCESLCNIELPSSLTHIGSHAFQGCNSLESIYIPKNVMYLGSNGGNPNNKYRPSFNNCEKLHKVVLEDGDRPLNIIGSYSSIKDENREFEKCPIDTVYIGRNLTGIDFKNVFREKTTLKAIAFGQHVSTPLILYKTGIEKLFIGDSMTKVEWSANCPELKEIYLGRGITSLSNETFYGCPKLSKVFIFSDEFSSITPNCIPKTVSAIYCADPERYRNIFTDYYLDKLIVINNSTSEYSGKAPVFSFKNNAEGTNVSFASPGLRVDAGSYNQPIPVTFFTDTWCSYAEIPVSYSITPAPLTVIANNAYKQYGEDNPEFTCSYFGFKNNETENVLTKLPDIATTANQYSPVGTYPIVASAAESHNYTFDYERGTLTITKAHQTIEWEQSFGAIGVGDIVELSAVSTSGLPIRYSVSDESIAELYTQNGKKFIEFIKPGFITIRANQDGNENYTEADRVSKSVTVKSMVSELGLNQTSITIHVGGTYKLIPTISPSDASDKTLAWSTTNPEIAIVDDNGNIKAVSQGETVVIAKTTDGSNISASCAVKVIADVSSISLNITSATIPENQTLQLSAVITPNHLNNTSLKWESSDLNVASVNGDGLVTGISQGTAVITVTATDAPNVSATCQIQVIKLVESIILNETSAIVTEGDILQLAATSLPATATHRLLEWSSSDNNVASVDNTGLVKANSAGFTKITVSATDGSNVYAVCDIEVKKAPILISSIILTPTNIKGLVGDTYQLHASIIPDNATNKNLHWESSNSTVASIEQNGSLSLLSKGDAIITVCAADNSGVEAICSVTVDDYTGIDNTQIDENSDIEVYTLTGLMIYKGFYSDLNLSPGMYIIHINGCWIKKMVR